jgi:hypothetical protein
MAPPFVSKPRSGWYYIVVESTFDRGFGEWHVKHRPRKLRSYYFLKQSETSSTIIANKVGCNAAYVGVVRKEFLRSQEP